MKKAATIITFLLMLFCDQKGFGQNFAWAKQIGGTLNQNITDKLTDKTNKIVYSGITNGIADLDPGAAVFNVHGSITSNKGFISKLDTAGNAIWIDTFGGEGSINIESIAVDDGNNIYATGSFQGHHRCDPGMGQTFLSTTHATGTIFFLKLDPGGNLLWAKSITGTALNLNQGYDIIVSKLYGIYLAGTFGNGNIDFDPGSGVTLLSAPVRHIFVAKYDYDGALVWARSYGGDGPEESCVMDTDYEGNIYLSGQFSSNCDFDPGPNVVMPYPNSAEKLYVCKWDKDGNFKWVRCFVGTGGSSYCNDIDFDGNDMIYVCGAYNGTMNFNDGGDGGIMTSNSSLSSFVVKLDTAGTYQWSFSIDFSRAESGFVDVNKDYYIAGHFYSSNVDFDPGSGSAVFSASNFVETYVGKYTPTGNFIWVRTLQSAGLSRAYTLTLDTLGGIYTGGVFNGNVDFDPSSGTYPLTAVAVDDIYIHKMNQCYINRGISLSGTTLNAAAINVNYSWIDCNTGLPIPGANAASFTPVQTGSYAVVLTNGPSCKDTSVCMTVEIIDTGTSIAEHDISKWVEVHPNPNNGTFMVELPPDYTVNEFWISDALGRGMNYRVQPTQNFLSINGGLQSGLYFINLRLQNGLMVRKKVVVQ